MYITKFYKCLYIPFLTKKKVAGQQNQLRIRGVASTYGFIDSCNDVVMSYALDDFFKSLKKMGGSNAMPKMLYEHIASGSTIGVWENISSTETSLAVEGVIYSKPIIQEVLSGNLQGLSIGFYVQDYEMRDDIRYLHKIALEEISLVKEPANPTAFCAPRDTLYYARSEGECCCN